MDDFLAKMPNFEQQFFVIAGPCVLESEDSALFIADELARVSLYLRVPIIFKASFDKANRTSVNSYRGPGIENGIRILSKVKMKSGLPVLSDIHTPDQAGFVADVLDMIQIPAFLSRQTDLLVNAGKTRKVINIKKGQFQSPEDMTHAIEKVCSTGNKKILLTERGSTFGYNDLVADMRSIPRMQRLGFPVIFDATHSAQFPGKESNCSGGDRSLVPMLARAAVAAGANGVFMEVHPDPDRALCDGPNSIYLDSVESLISNLRDIHALTSPARLNNVSPSHLAGKYFADTDFKEKLRRIKLIIFDVDGILTPGGIIFGSGDLEIKYFHVRDGHGIKIAKRIGIEIAFLTGRSSQVVLRRANELGVELVFQGLKDKRPALAQIMEQYQLRPEEIAVAGDDVVDIPLMRRVGVRFTVPEAPKVVVSEVDYVTKTKGGFGAAREIIDMIIEAQGKVPEVMERYYAP